MVVTGPQRTSPLAPLEPIRRPLARPDLSGGGITGNTGNAGNVDGAAGLTSSLGNTRVAQNTRSHGTEPLDQRAQFPPPGAVTRETLLGAVLADTGKNGMAVTYTGGTAHQKAQIEKIADLAIKVGARENVDPRILFAMAMKESTLGLNTDHASSAQGITGLKPTSAPDASARHKLGDPEVCLTQTARYLKGQIVSELNARGYNVSASDLAPGNFGDNTRMLLLSYRHGAGGFNALMDKHGDLNHVINGSVNSRGRHVAGSDYKKLFGYLNDMGL